MICLLDTHAFLWSVFAPEKLSASARKQICAQENRVCVSAISFWEIAADMRLEIIQIKALESASFLQLPKLRHKDPFDRMIIWQAIRQTLVLILKDAAFPEYESFGLKVLW